MSVFLASFMCHFSCVIVLCFIALCVNVSCVIFMSVFLASFMCHFSCVIVLCLIVLCVIVSCVIFYVSVSCVFYVSFFMCHCFMFNCFMCHCFIVIVLCQCFLRLLCVFFMCHCFMFDCFMYHFYVSVSCVIVLYSFFIIPIKSLYFSFRSLLIINLQHKTNKLHKIVP